MPQAQEALEERLAALEASWAGLSAADWELPVAYRNSTLLATQPCWWREIEIHSVDLDFGYGVEDWGLDLSAHVVDHLLSRLPGAFRLTAEDTGRRREVGSGAAAELSGSQRDLAAWLAGRRTANPLNGPMPELGPWP